MSFLVKDQPFVIAIDFDNTICIPTTGLENPAGYQPVPHIREFLSNLYSNYHCNFFLYTSRSGELYNYALNFLIEQSLDKYFILPDSPDYYAAVPFTPGRKLYADFYIDDLAVGAPLITSATPPIGTVPTPFPEYINLFKVEYAIVSKITNFCLANNIELPKR